MFFFQLEKSEKVTIDQRGISLIESLLVIIVVGSMVFLMANIPSAIGLINKSKHLSLASEIAAKQIEDKRSAGYENLVNGEVPINDSRLNALPQGEGEVEVENCDPSLCTNGEQLKQVTIEVTWRDNNKTQQVKLKTLISQGGLN